MKTVTLWRAADWDGVMEGNSFARDERDARAYLDNPGFGGASLYRAEVEVDESRVLDTRDMTEEQVAEIYGHHVFGVDVCEWIPRLGARDLGERYDWVIVTDNYPAGAECWQWIGGDEPELVEVED